MKLIRYAVPLFLVLILASCTPIHAQGVSVDFGLGTASNGSNGACINTFDEMTGSCLVTPELPGSPTPSMARRLFGKVRREFHVHAPVGCGRPI